MLHSTAFAQEILYPPSLLEHDELAADLHENTVFVIPNFLPVTTHKLQLPPAVSPADVNEDSVTQKEMLREANIKNFFIFPEFSSSFYLHSTALVQLTVTSTLP